MELRELPVLADDLPAYHELRKQVTAGGLFQMEGLPASAKALLLTQLARETGRHIVIVTYNADQAERLTIDFERFGIPPDDIARLDSSLDSLFFTEGAPDLGLLGSRTAVLQRMARGELKIVVGPISAFLQRTVPVDQLRELRVTLTSGEAVDIDGLEKTLLAYGYERVEAVELPGQWTRRGGIVDIFPGDAAVPLRVDFFGDDIDSIRPFDPQTQRSFGQKESLRLIAVREVPHDPAAVRRAVELIRREMPARIAELRRANLEGRGEQHAERLEERVLGDIAQLSAGTYTDQTEYYLPYLFPEPVSAFDYLPADAVLVLDEPNQARARWDQVEGEMAEIATARAARGEWLNSYAPESRERKPGATTGKEPLAALTCPFDDLVRSATKARATVMFSLLGRGVDGLRTRHSIHTQSGQMEMFAGRLPTFFEALDAWLGSRFRVVIVTEQPSRVREVMGDHKVPVSPADRLQSGGEGGVFVLEGNLFTGFKIPEASLIVASDTDIFGHRAHQKDRKRAFKEGLKITSYLELREGDYVVHINHGIGRYAGIKRLKGPDGAERDYLLIEYEAPDKVYVPTDQVDRVQKYIGSSDTPPSITRLDTGEWARATKKARKQVQEMAAELIKLYAARKTALGHAAPPDTPWQEEMEDAFPYEETPDQLAAIEDVKKDLEDEKPMDRLICGDVGYGKTEVAIRAAFKVVNGNRQVAVLCPTTILAQQHLGTFRDRLAQYPVKIEMLSRFVSKSETDRIVKALAEGTVDIVVATHKLLSKDVKFSNLGLLVVDEEQRFGVAHKERIKAIKRNVDVLTMTATPIPRTLHMSLSGIRDMSLIDDPPEGRLPIKTYVKEYDDELVREVILRELDRGGQVYYLHNRVESITHIAEHIRKLVSQAKVEIAHGQMHEDDLEHVMVRFANRDFNVLVCTTIIESGLDIPNVNTILVDNADKLGLAQLYQLRGRVGRSRKQGYAYLMYRKDKVLTEVAEKRLGALREFSSLGSGYKVSMRDLEIRGAGNLLGAEQSGTVATVGFDLYTQLLSQAINELKGEDVQQEWELPNVSLPLDAHIASRYIPSEAERILIYKKLAAVRTREHVDRIQEELDDRYGDPPRAVWNLLATLRLRLRCREISVGSIVAEKRRVAIRFQGTHLSVNTIKRLSRQHMQHQFLPDVVFLSTPDTPARMLTMVEEMIELLAKAMEDAKHEKPVDPPPSTPRRPVRYGAFTRY
ncbi:MAG: transcription-repair coupling factor [Capsulimonadaceae bacterium]